MNKKLKEEFNRQISSSPLSKSEDRKRFDEWLQTNRTVKKKRYWVPQVVTVLLLLGLATVLLSTNGNIFNILSTDQHPFEEFYEESYYSEDFELIDYVVGVFHDQDVLAIYDGPPAMDTSVTELQVGYFQYSEDGHWINMRGRPLSMSNPSVWEVDEEQYIYTLNTDKSIKEVRGNEKTFSKITLDHHILWYNTDSSLYTDLHQQSDQSFSEVNIGTPDELLSTEKGKLSVRLISEEVLQGADGMHKLYDSVAGDFSEFKAQSGFGVFKKRYPTLPINQEPVFLFFDTETLLYQTNNINDAIAFANNYYLEDEVKTLGEEFNTLLGDAEVEKGYIYHDKEESAKNVEINNIDLDNIIRETSDLKLEEQQEPVITDYKIEFETSDNRSITIEFNEDGLVLMENSSEADFYSIKGQNELMEFVKGIDFK